MLAAVVTTDPIYSATKLQQLKYDHLSNHVDVEMFHASEDKQFIRDSVINAIKCMQDTIAVHYIFAQKNKTNPAIQASAQFYARLGAALVRYIVEYKSSGYGRVTIIFDKCLRGKDQKAFLKEVKPKMKSLNKPYQIFFHRVMSDFNGQIADYCAWAKYVALEKNEMRPQTSIRNITKSEFDLFKNGRVEYY